MGVRRAEPPGFAGGPGGAASWYAGGPEGAAPRYARSPGGAAPRYCREVWEAVGPPIT